MATKKAVKYWGIGTVAAVLLIGGLALKEHLDRKEAGRQMRAADAAQASQPAEIVRRPEPEPVFTPPKETDPSAVRLIDAAMRAVYAHCAGFSIREGATFEGTLVMKGKRDPDRVNVSMKLLDPRKSDGNVLWYMITFDDSGQPALIRALKREAAELCGFAAADTDRKVVL